MSVAETIQAELASLKAASDAEHEQAAVVLKKIVDLEAQIATGSVSPADQEAILASIRDIKTGIQGIIPDAQT